MSATPDRINTWQMVEPGKLARTAVDVPELKSGEVLESGGYTFEALEKHGCTLSRKGSGR